MAIRRIDEGQMSAQTQEYVYEDEEYGITKDDGAVLIFRPLTAAEWDAFDARLQKCIKTKSRRGIKGRKGKADEMVYESEIDSDAIRAVINDRIKSALIDWRGFVEEDGKTKIPYSWEQFEIFAAVYRSLTDFADECAEAVYSDAIAKLDDDAKNLSSGSASESSPDTPEIAPVKPSIQPRAK